MGEVIIWLQEGCLNAFQQLPCLFRGVVIRSERLKVSGVLPRVEERSFGLTKQRGPFLVSVMISACIGGGERGRGGW